MALTAKQALFVKHYLINFNATDAAIKAGYSEKTAFIIGHENLKKPNIMEAISEASQERHKRLEWTADEILRDIREIAQDRSKRDNDRLKAYELGGRAIAMFTDKVDHSGSMVVFNGEHKLED